MIRHDGVPLAEFLRSQIELQRLQSGWTSAVTRLRSKVESQRSIAHTLSSQILSSQMASESIRDEVREAKMKIKKSRHELQSLKRRNHRVNLEIESTAITIEKAKLDRRREEIIGRTAPASTSTTENAESPTEQKISHVSAQEHPKIIQQKQKPRSNDTSEERRSSEMCLGSLQQQNRRIHCEVISAIELTKFLLCELGCPDSEHSDSETAPSTWTVLKNLLLKLNDELDRQLPFR